MRAERAGVTSLTAHDMTALERVQMGGHYEQWLASGFSQAAYKARDITEYGSVLPETQRRVRNERKGLALEKLGEPFVTKFEYTLTPAGLAAEDGELFSTIFIRGHEQALLDASQDHRLAFRAKRSRADVVNSQYINALARDPSVPVGTTVVIDSPSPDHNDLNLPIELLEEYHYRPKMQMAMRWVATKTQDGIQLQTINVFHAEPHELAESLSVVARQPVALKATEDMPWQRTVFTPDQGVDVAQELVGNFDAIKLRDLGAHTSHGLELDERAGANAVELVEGDTFSRALDASDFVIDQIAASLATKQLMVERAYLEEILSMEGADGSYELQGSEREKVLRVLGSDDYSLDDLHTALRVAQQVADASLWSTLRRIVDGEAVEVSSDVQEAAHQGVSSVESHRQQGSVEYGCQGEGTSKQAQKSIFDMSSDELASAFMRTIFITNCPLCDEKGVTATKENGTITCGDCGGCVDVCTGEVLRKASKKQKAAAQSGKAVAKTMMSPVDWLFNEFAEYGKKRRLQTQKRGSNETIALRG
ncbi:hypothetical protein KC973_03965 [Candidatus Saccharibacteria bacterium]|nr:hypothetical protein [Candidatus Saccharibacteria bacterium]